MQKTVRSKIVINQFYTTRSGNSQDVDPNLNRFAGVLDAIVVSFFYFKVRILAVLQSLRSRFFAICI